MKHFPLKLVFVQKRKRQKVSLLLSDQLVKAEVQIIQRLFFTIKSRFVINMLLAIQYPLKCQHLLHNLNCACVCVLNQYSTWHLGGPKKRIVAIKTQIRLPSALNLPYNYLFLHSLIFSPWLSPFIYRIWIPWAQKTSEKG